CSLASSDVRRQTMHQQCLGAPGDSKNAAKSGQVAGVTARKSREWRVDIPALTDVDFMERPRPFNVSLRAAKHIDWRREEAMRSNRVQLGRAALIAGALTLALVGRAAAQTDEGEDDDSDAAPKYPTTEFA